MAQALARAGGNAVLLADRKPLAVSTGGGGS